MRKLPIKDAVVECEFRLVGKASFAGIVFNGSQERGHIVHLVLGKDQLRILAHPKPKESIELFKQANALDVDGWHGVRIEFSGETMIAKVDDMTITASNPCIGEEKLTIGLGGDSGGPEGEKAGALEFRKLVITAR